MIDALVYQIYFEDHMPENSITITENRQYHCYNAYAGFDYVAGVAQSIHIFQIPKYNDCSDWTGRADMSACIFGMLTPNGVETAFPVPFTIGVVLKSIDFTGGDSVL